MKKIMAMIMALGMILSVACAGASAAEGGIFETLSGMEWIFCSGVGGWSTDLQIRADGSFIGDFHDSEMGETGAGYPDGTVYICSFSGRMSLAEQVDGSTWKMRIDQLVTDQTEETISDGVRYVPSSPYGISEGDEMLLYAPGTSVGIFTDDMLLWTHVQELEIVPDRLPDWFLCSEKNDSGFVGYQPVSMANPWEEMTAEQLTADAGLSFGVPDGAENVVYRYLRSEGLAEMQFTRANGEYCARIQPLALQNGELADIAGMYYDWTYEEPVNILGCYGRIAQAQDDGGIFVERCLWYDAASGLMYSLSVTAADIDGLDLTALAGQIGCSVQGE